MSYNRAVIVRAQKKSTECTRWISFFCSHYEHNILTDKNHYTTEMFSCDLWWIVGLYLSEQSLSTIKSTCPSLRSSLDSARFYAHKARIDRASTQAHTLAASLGWQGVYSCHLYTPTLLPVVAVTDIVAWDIQGHPWLLSNIHDPLPLHAHQVMLMCVLYYTCTNKGTLLLYQTADHSIRVCVVVRTARYECLSVHDFPVHNDVKCAFFSEPYLALCNTKDEILITILPCTERANKEIIKELYHKRELDKNFFVFDWGIIYPSLSGVAQIIMTRWFTNNRLWVRTTDNKLLWSTGEDWVPFQSDVKLIYRNIHSPDISAFLVVDTPAYIILYDTPHLLLEREEGILELSVVELTGCPTRTAYPILFQRK